MKNRNLVLFIVVLMIFSTASVFAAGQKEEGLVVAVDSLGDHLDPHRPPGNAAHPLMALFDGLTRLDADGNLQPSIAESWESVNDTTWRFKIREGIKFHNGEALDAELVKLNLDRMMDPDEPRAKYSFSVVESYRVVDENTIEVVTVASDPLLPHRMTGMLIAPKSMLANAKSTDFNAGPIGTGPFKFVEWVPEERITLVANEEYFRGAPEIKQLTFRPIPEKYAQISELLTGGVDVVENIPPDFIEKIEANDLAGIVTKPSPVNHTIILRTDVESPFTDKRVRQAMNYAVNVDEIIESMFQGYAHREATCVHPWVFGFNADVKPYSEDLDKAKALLAEAGYADGFEIDFEVCPAVGDLYNMEVAQIIVEQLKRVGVKVNLQSVEYGVMRRKVYGDRTVVPMFRWNWKTWYNDPDGVMYGFFHSDSIGAFVKNPELDKMIMDARFNLDQADRDAIYKKLQEYVREEAYHIALYYLDTIYGVSSRIEWEPRADARLYFYDVKLK